MRIVDAAATHQALPFGPLIAALRQLHASGCESPPRWVLELPQPTGPAMTSLLMPAWQTGGCYGVKIINIAPGNAARGLPGLHGSYLLHDASTGQPLAFIDGDALTQRRTAGCAALAAASLARPDASHLLVVGGGRIARLLPAAYGAVRPIRRVTVWTRRPEQGQALADEWRREGIDAQASNDLAVAVRAADIISCATLASSPVIQGHWLSPGQHLALIGSFTPTMREADSDCLRGATLVVDTPEAWAKSGDLLAAVVDGTLAAPSPTGQPGLSLADLCRNTPLPDAVTPLAQGQRHSVYKSVGHSLQDLAAAMLVHASVANA
ncbi:MAG: hypothetical protein RL722_1710 [Pseudomonadota bacterium]|jgi:ornithine cyclodeaminase